MKMHEEAQSVLQKGQVQVHPWWVSLLHPAPSSGSLWGNSVLEPQVVRLVQQWEKSRCKADDLSAQRHRNYGPQCQRHETLDRLPCWQKSRGDARETSPGRRPSVDHWHLSLSDDMKSTSIISLLYLLRTWNVHRSHTVREYSEYE
jgi:hypothetical protein